MVYPRNARSLAAWIPVTPGDLVGMVGLHEPLERSLVNAGAKVVPMPRDPSGDPGVTDPLAHLVVLSDNLDVGWLAPGVAADAVGPGGTVLAGVRHRWNALRRSGVSAGQLERTMAATGVVDCRVFGVSHGMHNLRALVPLEPPLMRWYAEQAFLPRSYRGGLGIRSLCRLGTATPLRALFPMIVAIGTVRSSA